MVSHRPTSRLAGVWGYRMNGLKNLTDVLGGTARGRMELESMIICTFKKSWLRVRSSQSICETLPCRTKSIIDFIP